MDFNELYPSKFLKALDLKGDLVLTIAGVAKEELGQEREIKPVVSFVETERKLALNKTNALQIASLHGGGDLSAWVGKRIALYPTKVPFGGKLVDTIRVRPTVPTAASSVSELI